MEYTEKLHLNLPAETDPLEIEKLNENFRKLDPLGGGVEALQNGLGPGSLIFVSKHYKEPIADALLCNGGTVSVDTYPELYGVLGSAYGETLGCDSLTSQYGINSTYGYPIAYNRDKDIVIGAGINAPLTLYRKNQSPVYVPFSPSIGTWTGDKVAFAVSAGDYIFCGIPVPSTNNTPELKSCCYKISVGIWSATDSNASRLLSHAKDSGAPVVETKKYVVSAISSQLAAVNKTTGTAKLLSLKWYNTPGTAAYGKLLLNGDRPLDDDRVYIIASNKTTTSSSTNVQVGYITDAEIDAADTNLALTNSVTTISDGTETINPSQNYGGIGAISGNYLYMFSSTPNFTYDTNAHIYRAYLGSSTTSFISCFDVTASNRVNIESGFAAGYLISAFNRIGNRTLLFPFCRKASYLIEGTSGQKISQSTYPVSRRVQHPDEPMVTSTGVVANHRITNFKLPSISPSSEMLVYIRTKGVS